MDETVIEEDKRVIMEDSDEEFEDEDTIVKIKRKAEF